MDYEKLIEWLKKTVLGRICALGGQREGEGYQDVILRGRKH